jgi:hypothetical protein
VAWGLYIDLASPTGNSNTIAIVLVAAHAHFYWAAAI